jgi:hypothetical protein
MGWYVLVHYPDDPSNVVPILSPVPKKPGDRVVIVNDLRPWVAKEIHYGEGDLEGKAHNLEVSVELPAPAA